MNRLLTASLALALASLASLTQAAETSAPASAAAKTGEAIKHGATKAGEAVGTTVERTEAGVEKGAKKVGKAVKHGAEKTGEVIGTTADPATPYEWAQALASQLSSGVLLTHVGEGHTSLGQGSGCVDNVVVTYLLNLTPPAKNSSAWP